MMASLSARKRLIKEYKKLTEDPVDLIEAHPEENNILIWHYVITGPPDTPYSGGQYHGNLIFPPLYPFKPPAIQMCTPNGRFLINTKLCLSFSDYHPELWNPSWNVGTILTGLLSFMTGTENTAGSTRTTIEQKRQFAKTSISYNTNSPVFKKEFPHLLNLPAKAPTPISTPNTVPSDTRSIFGASVPTSVETLLLRKRQPVNEPREPFYNPHNHDITKAQPKSAVGEKRPFQDILYKKPLHVPKANRSKPNKDIEVFCLDDDDNELPQGNKLPKIKDHNFLQREVIDLYDDYNDELSIIKPAKKKKREEPEVFVID